MADTNEFMLQGAEFSSQIDASVEHVAHDVLPALAQFLQSS